MVYPGPASKGKTRQDKRRAKQGVLGSEGRKKEEDHEKGGGAPTNTMNSIFGRLRKGKPRGKQREGAAELSAQEQLQKNLSEKGKKRKNRSCSLCRETSPVERKRKGPRIGGAQEDGHPIAWKGRQTGKLDGRGNR